MRAPVWRPVLLFAAAMPLSGSAHDGLPVGWRLVSPEPGAFSARVDREQTFRAVDRTAPMPRSHPVLTLDTGSRDENEILSSLLHEQFHWLALADQKRLGAVVGDLRARYPDAPSGPPDGGRDLNGTYLHLVVNALELQAMERLLGRAAAEKMLRVRPYYRWIYRTVIEDREAIGEIFARHGVTLP